MCFTPETAFTNEFLRSLWDQGHRKEEERENRDEMPRLHVCGMDELLAAISRSTSDTGPIPISTGWDQEKAAQGGVQLKKPAACFT